jgi:hypothetical protein
LPPTIESGTWSRTCHEGRHNAPVASAVPGCSRPQHRRRGKRTTSQSRSDGHHAALPRQLQTAGVIGLLADKSGKVHYQNLLGYADVEVRKPIREDNMFWIASMTKMFAGASTMMLADEGKVSLDDPVPRFVPQLEKWMAVEEKAPSYLLLKLLVRPVPVRQVLSHPSDLTGSSELQQVTGSDSTPVAEDIPFLKTDAKKVRGQPYDMVVNGVELGGGSIRIHHPDVQETVFEEVLQIPPDMVKARFGYMLEAFRYGAPPHGGIALGFDRLIAILCGTPSIRDVIAFPKTAKGTCLMTDSPAGVEPKQLRELYLELKAAKKP